MSQAGFLFAHFQTGFDRFLIPAAIENEIAKGGLVRIGFLDIFGDPIGHLAVGDGIFDDLDEMSAAFNPAALSQSSVEALGEIFLIIGVKFAGRYAAGFCPRTGADRPSPTSFRADCADK